jgi:hypothetical protein
MAKFMFASPMDCVVLMKLVDRAICIDFEAISDNDFNHLQKILSLSLNIGNEARTLIERRQSKK